jgi:tetratricopeptide (TPR) repeat protein
MEAGNADVAAMFFGHASEIDPTHAAYRAFYMDALIESDPDAAEHLAREVLADDAKHDPMMVARAAAILRINEAGRPLVAESAQRYRDLIPVLERNLARIENEEHVERSALAYVITVGELGLCQEFLGNFGAAVDYYSRGLRVAPKNNGLLVARGILLYGTSPRAINDFEQAVGLGSPVVLPYLYLAHHYLITRRFDQCRVMCETGLRMRGSDTAKSQLEQWRAIAQAELGFPAEFVRSAFDAALHLDPSNELARRNQDAFEALLRTPHASRVSRWEEESETALRQFGLAERRYPVAA